MNNLLLEKYGKNYISELGFADFAGAVASVSGVIAEKNFAKLVPPEPKAQKPVKSPKAEPAAAVQQETVYEQPADEESVKLELNAIKRDVFAYITENENAATAPALGNRLTQKYGRGYLKILGFTTLKKLLSVIKGIKVKGSAVSIDESFIQRTDEIEQFVYDFARGEGKRSIKALSGQLRKRFEGFDFNDYGYSRFSDFINAIDGVRANGYYVVASE